MAKDFYDKLTAIADATSKNKAVLILILGMLSSGVTNAFQYVAGIDNLFMKNILVEQVTLLATAKECKK